MSVPMVITSIRCQTFPAVMHLRACVENRAVGINLVRRFIQCPRGTRRHAGCLAEDGKTRSCGVSRAIGGANLGESLLVVVFSIIRIGTLSGERIALNRLGQKQVGALAVMGVGFGGAAVVLWAMDVWQQGEIWTGSAIGTGALYAVGFGFYTASLTRGPVNLVSPWSNATVIMLWLYHPVGGPLCWFALATFALGAFLLTDGKVTPAVVWMLVSDALLAAARILDAHHLDHAPIAYATSLFTVISLWMLIPILLSGRLKSVCQLMLTEPGWSFVAASSNAAAYLSLFCLLHWLHPTAVEAISAVASSVAALLGVYVMREPHAKWTVLSSALMTAGTVILLYEEEVSMR